MVAKVSRLLLIICFITGFCIAIGRFYLLMSNFINPCDEMKKNLWGGEMKNVIISADGDRMVYAVPNIVADNLTEYCIEFCDKWLRTSAYAKKYRRNGVLCYNERDFIEYLNRFKFPQEPSVFIENLGPIGIDELPIPERYKDCPMFHF